jgi:hypothetical protein
VTVPVAHLQRGVRKVTVAATQFACTWDLDGNLARAEALARRAARDGAQVILLQELFETPYFCIENSRHLRLATTLHGRASAWRGWPEPTSCCRSVSSSVRPGLLQFRHRRRCGWRSARPVQVASGAG